MGGGKESSYTREPRLVFVRKIGIDPPNSTLIIELEGCCMPWLWLSCLCSIEKEVCRKKASQRATIQVSLAFREVVYPTFYSSIGSESVVFRHQRSLATRLTTVVQWVVPIENGKQLLV